MPKLRAFHLISLGLFLGALLTAPENARAEVPGGFLTEAVPSSPESEKARAKRPEITQKMNDAGLDFGASVFIRIVKKSSAAVEEKALDLPQEEGKSYTYRDGSYEIWERDNTKKVHKFNVGMGSLELYVRDAKSGEYRLFKSYPIRNYSGTLGTKRAEGDYQAVEGFYSINEESMNPFSSALLSFNLGYPNEFDRNHGRTGSYLMVHGKTGSAGCYAMGDDIYEIYTIVEGAFENGQKKIDIQALPFPLTSENLARFPADHPEFAFWNEELRPGFEYFEKNGIPPAVQVHGKHYAISDPAPSPSDLSQGLEWLSAPGRSALENSGRIYDDRTKPAVPGPTLTPGAAIAPAGTIKYQPAL